MSQRDIAVFSPSLNAQLRVGRSCSICWACARVDAQLSIELRLGDRKLYDIAPHIPNHGVHTWTLPTSLPSSTSYCILIKCIQEPDIWGCSALFEVVNEDSTITMPPPMPSAPPVHHSLAKRPMALVEQLLSQSEQAQLPPSKLVSVDPPSPSVPMLPFGQRGLVKRHFTYGALQQQSKKKPPRRAVPKLAQPPQLPQVTALPIPSLPTSPVPTVPAIEQARLSCTNGPEVKMSASTVRRCLQQLLNEPDMTIDTMLANNETAGQFSIKYILMHAQKRESKRKISP